MEGRDQRQVRRDREPRELRRDGETTIVVAKVSGTFPGSPANLTYSFGFSPDSRISALAIR
jgi:hypothetical protein